jgi:fumarylacetoacetase
MFRGPANALNPNWKFLPVGYHGRASSVAVSGQTVRRPWGLVPGSGERKSEPEFTATAELDFELELAALIGVGNPLGERIPVANAIDHIFGFVLMNDWSARDIQRFEYVPLGPFLGKNFLTSISPWVVPLDALRPFLLPSTICPQVPPVLDYLKEDSSDGRCVRFGAELQVKINGTSVCRSDARNLYWSFSQMVAHHTVGGCNLQPGDLLGSGTISGTESSSFGSLLELSWNKTRPVTVGPGQTRLYLEDGDSVEMTGVIRDERTGEVVIDFGVCQGTVSP